MSPQSPPQPLIIAHRGESRDAPENTLASVQLAWDRGAAAVEIDVRPSADGDAMVIHDADTRRIGGPRLPVHRQPTAALRALDAGAWKHRRWAGERLPLLAEVLATVPPGGRLFIELKEGPESVAAVARALATASIEPAQVLVMSFHPNTVAAAAAALPEVEVSLLFTARHWVRRGAPAHAVERARALGARSLNLEIHRRLGAAVVEAVHAAGLHLYCWTVNREATARRLAAAGIDGITTDRCAWMRDRLRSGA